MAAAKEEETPAAGAEEGAETPAEGEETPAEGAETPAEGEEGEEAPEDGGGGEGPAPITGKRAHLRLPPESDKVGRLALSISKRNPDVTLEEAMERARTQLGIKPKTAETAAPANLTPGADAD